MAFVPGTLGVADETLNRAVSNALNRPLYIQPTKRSPRFLRSALNEQTPAAAGEPSGYRGYFTIEDASEEGEGGVIVPKVKVWDPRTPGSQSQPCYVNGKRTTLSQWTSANLSAGKTYILVHYRAASGSTPASVTIEALHAIDFPSSTGTDVYHQLGFVILSESGEMQIFQDHVVGIVRMIWYSGCAFEV